METIKAYLFSLLEGLVTVLTLPIEVGSRLFFLYLVSSIFIAACIYVIMRRRDSHPTETDAADAQGSFLRFLFPKRVWSHPSAWLDLRYLFFHRVAAHGLLVATGGWALATGFRFGSGHAMTLQDVITTEGIGTWSAMGLSVVYMFVVVLIADFLGWLMHYLQHKVPLLWQFHKVHHSAEVMHPVSNFREHPIDNITYGVVLGAGYGLVQGLAVRYLGYIPSMPSLLGLPVLLFLFNFAGYNLRHSHVWLRWPGVWSMVFPSPAHHHVHHSRHPDHIDKNFAFMFPVWDVIFRTYHMPEDGRDVEFGIDEDASDLSSVTRLYWVPFRDAFRLFRKPKPKPEDAHKVPAE